MTAIKKTLTFLTLFLTVAAVANSIGAKPLNDDKNPTLRQIIGTWQLKQTLPDGKTEKAKNVEEQIRTVNPAVPNSLILAADDELGEITINENFEKVVHTQTLPLNAGNSAANGKTVKAFWQNKKLIVEVFAADGAKMTETFELGANKNQLKVTLRLDNSAKSKSIVAKRIYDRASDEQTGGEQTTAEINVSQYLF